MNRKTELTEHIKQVLHEHEEAYVLGSWERFQQNKSRENRIHRQRLFFAVAAAILLILTVVFAWSNMETVPDEQYAEDRQTEQPKVTENESVRPPSGIENPTPPSPGAPSESETEGSENMIAENKIRTETSLPGNPQNSFIEVAAVFSGKSVPQVTLVNWNDLPRQTETQQANDVLIDTRPSQLPAIRTENSLPDEFVRNEDIRNLSKRTQKDVVFSIAYASVMNVHHSQTDFGVGGGFYTDWNFARNLSASSGIFIAQNRLKYDADQGNRLMENFEGSTTTRMSADDLAYIQLDLVNLEIPFNLRYYLTDKLSVSAGISAITFLKEQYDYNFEFQQQIQVFETNETTGIEPVTREVTLRTSQTQSEPSLDRVDWAGFYTFSVSYQKDLFDRHTASFEPFLKVPAGNITSRGFTYTTGGVQLKISF